VRRISSISLLLLLLLPLISPIFAATAAETNLPACCRRDGKHHCAISTVTKSRAINSGAIQATVIREKCPSYPAPSATAHTNLSHGEARATAFSNIISFETRIAQTEACRRISFDRSRHKRGPPNQPLSLL
jgi:hypothetical protein